MKTQCLFKRLDDTLFMFVLFLATASYRLLPDITLTKQVTGMMAHRLKSVFQME